MEPEQLKQHYRKILGSNAEILVSDISFSLSTFKADIKIHIKVALNTSLC